MSSPQPRTATTKTVTEINRTAVLDALHEHGPLSRKQLGARTGLSSATVERLTAALLTEALIAVDSLERSSGGRPSSLLRYDGHSRVVAAVEVAEDRAHGILIDLDGRTVVERTVMFDAAVQDRPHGRLASDRRSTTPLATTRLDGTVELVDRLLAEAAAIHKPCIGIGVSVPGIVHDGRVMNTIELGWREIPLGSILETRTGIPTHVENDANAIAYGEWARGAGAGAHSVASYVLGIGVGSGIVNDGTIYRGFRSAAGEVGYLFTERAALRRFFTEQGDLESRIADVAHRHAAEPEQTPPSTTAMQHLLDDAVAGEPGAAEAADELFDLIAFSCGALSTVLDPEVVVLAGHLTRHPQFAIDQISKRLVGRIPFPPRLVAGTLGAHGALLGVGDIIARQVRGSTYLA